MSARGVCSGNDKNRENVEHEHERKEYLGFAASSLKLLPHENTPERSNHRSGLADGIRNRYPSKICRDETENGSRTPNDPSQDAEQVT